jgi:hypothetical protein
MKKIQTEIKLGLSGCYVHDFGFSFLAEIPAVVAIAWVKDQCPNLSMSANEKITAEMLTEGGNIDTDVRGNGWLNKRFVIVGISNFKWLAVVKHDSRFYLYHKT